MKDTPFGRKVDLPPSSEYSRYGIGNRDLFEAEVQKTARELRYEAFGLPYDEDVAAKKKKINIFAIVLMALSLAAALTFVIGTGGRILEAETTAPIVTVTAMLFVLVSAAFIFLGCALVLKRAGTGLIIEIMAFVETLSGITALIMYLTTKDVEVPVWLYVVLALSAAMVIVGMASRVKQKNDRRK